MEKFLSFNDTVLSLMGADDKLSKKDLSAELYESNKTKIEVKKRLATINERLAHVNEPISPPSPNPGTINPTQHQNSPVRVSLPKLEVRKFGENISEWQEFWDSFESAIDKNETLADVDKFCYLRGLLVGSARSAIARFGLTSGNYKAATDMLKKNNDM